MIVCRTQKELNIARREAAFPCVLVPTMGGLHEGHLSLMERARQCAGTVLATLFVNRAQFDDPQDFSAYPREEQHDFELLETASVDVIYAPDEDAVWGDDAPDLEAFVMPGLTDVLEGAHRDMHLCAVAAVVTRLFDQTRPDKAVFGEKDYQQLVLVRRLAEARQPPIEIIAASVVREPDGLAMSSRNRHLNPEDRKCAAGLYRALTQAQECLQQGASTTEARELALAHIASAGLQADYVAICDPKSLRELEGFANRWVILSATRIGRVRLLDCLSGSTHG